MFKQRTFGLAPFAFCSDANN
jgi:hypothetical protein